MTDQYNMDQYNKETSQIHAPADLIRRTKEAVREEERRVAEERLQQNTAARPKHSYGKVYRWAFPVAAAVLCVILYNISGMMPGRNMSGSGSGSAMDMASRTDQSSDSGAGAQSGGIDMSESVVTVAEDESVSEDSEYETAAMDTGGEGYVSEDYSDGQLADTAVSARGDAATDSSAENSIREESNLEKGKNSYIESVYGSDLWIEEAEGIPDFYNNPDTKRVTIGGVELYVGKDFDEAWIAYAEIDAGKYIISTELTEEEIKQEEFVQAAYEVLIEKTGNAN